MTISNMLKELETTEHPVAKIFHKGENSRVLIIAFKKGMSLKEHKAQLTSKLLVLEGSVDYTTEEISVTLNKYDEVNIAANLIHAVTAKENSICILTQA